MTCGRCLGLMLPIDCLLHESDRSYLVGTYDRTTDRGASRCLNCGNIEDRIILQHRRGQHE